MKRAAGLSAGWCPGALRPMESGDGLIVRVRPRLGRLSIAQLELLGEAARRFGDGNLYLSNRANVQLRRIHAKAHGKLLDVLRKTGLIDSDPRAEAVRNVMVAHPVGAGALKLAARLEKLLSETEALYELPGKFGVAVQSGEDIDANAASDVTFVAAEMHFAMVLDEFEPVFLFDHPGACADAFQRVTLAFLDLHRQDPNIRRMRDAVKNCGATEISRKAGLAPSAIRLRALNRFAPVGDLGEAFGMGFAFGEVSQSALLEILRTMRRREVRRGAVSHHRALVFSVKSESKAEFQDLADRAGAITNPSDIRLRVHACPGMPACGRATVPSRRDASKVLHALELKGDFPGTVHISGCEKRCANSHHADIAAIGADGRYVVSASGQGSVTLDRSELTSGVLKLAEML